jgi:ATP-dependent DNA ligase
LNGRDLNHGGILVQEAEHLRWLWLNYWLPAAQSFVKRSGGRAQDQPIALFIEPMKCLPVEKIPEGNPSTDELKLDGYRTIAVNSGGKLTLRSRRGTDMTMRFEDVVAGLVCQTRR